MLIARPLRMAAGPAAMLTAVLAAGVVTGLAAVALSGCASAPPAPPIPPALDPGPTARLLLTTAASGVQVYECRAGATAGTAPAWAFVEPDAELFDSQGRKFGTHGAGPYWAAADGSRIVGSVGARADAPARADIPWLLLTARSTGSAGVLSAVTHVQRVATIGGIAPADGCNAGTLGQRARVPYRADYRYLGSV